MQIFSADARSPNNEPSKFFAYDFQGKFARFEFSNVSASIDNDRSILRAIDHVARLRADRRKDRQHFVAQRGRARYAHRHSIVYPGLLYFWTPIDVRFVNLQVLIKDAAHHPI
ncbi:hypothetical protein [Rhodoplanes elegans]|uniref:hypothetical protein n=1 Tax=Rhodoplanes elegans TaxID=29408 RepID=UPI0011B93BA3|nr:hypothetical protein [Rhodoplanes elegans]